MFVKAGKENGVDPLILLSIAASLIFFVLEGLLPLIDPRIRRGR